MDNLDLLIFVYTLSSIVAIAHYALKILLDIELFEDGIQVHHILFFPSLIVAFVSLIFICIAGFAGENPEKTMEKLGYIATENGWIKKES